MPITLKDDRGEGRAEEPTSSDLCLDCGLCCTGVLYARVDMKTPEEEALAEELALPVVTNDAGKQTMLQPCRCYVDGQCSIYERRFSTCRTYRCALLKNVEAGAVPAREALAVIAQARELLGALYRIMDVDEARQKELTIWGRVASYLKERNVIGSPERTAAHAKLLLTMRALSLLCHRHFEERIHEKWNENDRHRHPVLDAPAAAGAPPAARA